MYIMFLYLELMSPPRALGRETRICAIFKQTNNIALLIAHHTHSLALSSVSLLRFKCFHERMHNISMYGCKCCSVGMCDAVWFAIVFGGCTPTIQI